MKKIFLWGKYDIFSVGNIKYFKEPEDFMLLTIRVSEDFRHRTQLMIDGIKYIKNTDDIPAYRSMFKYFLREKPDFLAVMAEHESVASMQEFNRIKLFAEENGAEMIVIRPYIQHDGLITINPCNVYERLNIKATIS